MMGGLGAHEYMAPCPAGENEVVLAPGYAANLEVASAEPEPVALQLAPDAPEPVDTPGVTTCEDVARLLALPVGATLKSYAVVTGEPDEERVHLVLVRGDDRVNDIKLANALGAAPRAARPEQVERALGPAGYIGPVAPAEEVEILLDAAALAAASDGGGFVTGANRADTHLRGVVPGRDFRFREVDVRTVGPGDTIGGEPIAIEPAIEVGNIFKLGTRYSEPLGARYLDEQGVEHAVWMASYGIGPARIVAAAVEQFADAHGISWPRALAPFAVHLVALGKPGTPERDAADEVYRRLLDGGVEVLYDDRDLGPGEKFAEAELLGCPLRLTVGRRSIESGEIEVQVRRGREQAPGLPLDAEPQELVRAVQALWQSLP
jgi:prolyl-tRNA synthetase